MSGQQNTDRNGSRLPLGTMLQKGKYRIDGYISSGGFGNTYVATNFEMEQQVAIKEFFMGEVSHRDESTGVYVREEDARQEFIRQRRKFLKEARRLRKLHNDHIVSAYNLFEENGTAYYEMDLIRGETLNEHLKRTGQPFTEHEVLDILDQLLDGLAAVHEEKLVHLDLKPSNIMIDEDGRVLLIDFGASKQLKEANGSGASTTSTLALTPGYAPLEQVDLNIKKIGPWTDFYALGATIYKLLTTDSPPSATEMLDRGTTLTFPATVTTQMQELILWMMKSSRIERPQSVCEIRDYLLRHFKSEKTHSMFPRTTSLQDNADEDVEVIMVTPPLVMPSSSAMSSNLQANVPQRRRKKGGNTCLILFLSFFLGLLFAAAIASFFIIL